MRWNIFQRHGVQLDHNDADAGIPTPNHIYEMIWSIPREYGGMTSAMLQRSREFLHFGIAESITILTLATDLVPAETERHIQEQYNMSTPVNVRNIWHDLRFLPDDQLRKIKGAEPKATTESAPLEDGVEVRPGVHTFHDQNGKLTRREHFRPNGELLMVDDLSKKGDRLLTLLGANGDPLTSWANGSELYKSWIDYAMVYRPSLLINEHKSIGEFLVGSQFESVKLCQVIHGTHLARPGEGPYGKLLKARNRTIKDLESFDLVAVLTEIQKNSIESLGVDTRNIRVLPNSISPVENLASPEAPRETGKGVMLGKLSPLKRTGHAIRAVALIGPHSKQALVSLDVFGDGDRREELEELIKGLGATDYVKLRGHVPNAARELDNYSFLLLTSKNEGLSLAIMEAMAHGCIPIAYDVPYGPQELIVDGVNGFLVEPGNVDQLKKTIEKLIALPPEPLLQMRKSARNTIEQFAPETTMRKWKVALAEMPSINPRANTSAEKIRARTDSVRSDGTVCEIHGVLSGRRVKTYKTARLVIATRDGEAFLKVRPQWRRLTFRKLRFEAKFEIANIAGSNALLDFFVQPAGAPWSQKARLGAVRQFDYIAPRIRAYATKYGNLSMKVEELQ